MIKKITISLMLTLLIFALVFIIHLFGGMVLGKFDVFPVTLIVGIGLVVIGVALCINIVLVIYWINQVTEKIIPYVDREINSIKRWWKGKK